MIVRLVWERDGLELLSTFARDWVGRDVLVDIVEDKRWDTGGAWVDAADVERRTSTAESAPSSGSP